MKPGKLSGGVDLPLQQGMKRLNRHRITLKHHGGHPSRETIELIRNDTATFLAAASQLVFGVDYHAVSTSSLIPQEAVRDLVLNAEAANGRGERVDAMIALVDAWEELFNVQLSRAAERTSPLRFGPSIGRTLTEREIARYLYNENASRMRPRANEDIGRQIAGVTEVVMALQDAARLTAIGVDYAEYHRFLALTPHRDDYMTGRRTYRAPSTYAPSADDVTFCIHFVVNSALRLIAAETQLVEPEWIGAARAQRVPWQTIKEVPGKENQTGQT